MSGACLSVTTVVNVSIAVRFNPGPVRGGERIGHTVFRANRMTANKVRLSPRIRGVTVNPRPFLLPVVLGRYRGGRWNIASILQIDASICNCEPGRFAMCEPIAIKHNGH